MTKDQLRRLENMIHSHTKLVMIQCADHGHGCDHRKAVASANRLIDFIAELSSNSGGGPAIKAVKS